MALATATFLYVNHELDGFGPLGVQPFEGLTERHIVRLEPRFTVRLDAPASPENVVERARKEGAAGIVLEVRRGVPRRAQLRAARGAVRSGLEAFLHWPDEDAVERLDDERISSFWRLLLAYKVGAKVLRRDASAVMELKPQRIDAIEELADDPQPASLAPLAHGGHRSADGLYVRLDYWARISSGGSYGHTCFVAKELAATSRSLLCVMGTHFDLLDRLGLRQGVVDPPFAESSSAHLLRSTEHYLRWLEPVASLLQPGYIYERLVNGNAAAAIVARRHGIPYIVEYNGSEMEIARAYGTPMEASRELERIEDIAFAQASLVVVVSRHMADTLVARGVDPAKILVNPNGVDLDTYRPPTAAERSAVRAELGLAEDAVVVGFTGTFGGWHGVEVLAEAIAPTCAANDRVRWLLIGDGNLRHLVDSAVERAGVADRVVRTGRVPQAEGARYLAACDVFVAPHNGAIGSMPFFGSPTKLFEYMGCGGAIVASDLEQIGEVLRPAMTLAQLEADEPPPAGARAVLVAPGSADELVRAMRHLVRRRELHPVLGGNARAAAESEYAWSRNVARVWEACDVIVDRGASGATPNGTARDDARLELIRTGDRYKDETQKQWNNDPCGSQYVKDRPLHSLEWFLEAERYRYQEYGPWMPEVMEFDRHRGERLLEIGAGMGTDLAQFARHGAIVTDCDLSAGHLALARENFRLRGLEGTFVHADGETLPFPDDTFDVVYSNGVIHHTPNTAQVVAEIRRVLKPGGKVIVMVYAEDSWHYWGQLVSRYGVRSGMLERQSIGDVMSELVELGSHGAKPLVKVYTRPRLRRLFSAFRDVTIVKRQLTPGEVKMMPAVLRALPHAVLERAMGWNLVVKAFK